MSFNVSSSHHHHRDRADEPAPSIVCRTVQTLGQAVEQELQDRYTLVYTEQRDTLPDDVVAALVKGENTWETTGGDAFAEWESEVRWAGACDVVDELANDIVRRWEREDEADHDSLLDDEWPGSDQRECIIHTVEERDRSDTFDELVTSHGPVLLRVLIPAMNEDAGLSFASITCQHFLDLLGFEHTENNMTVAGEVIANASPEFSVAIGQALIGVDLETVAALPEDGKVELRNPHVWLGSPFSGSGWCSEEPFTGTLIVDRADLQTDDDAFGYSWDSVVGGTSPGDYAKGATLRQAAVT